DSGDIDIGIAVKTASGWFVGVVIQQHENRFCSAAAKLLDVTAVPAKAAVARFSVEGDCESGNGGQTWKREAVVAGGGAKPPATPLIAVKNHETSSDEPYNSAKVSRVTTDVALELSWTADGVTVKGKTTGLEKGAASDLLGKHAIAFP